MTCECPFCRKATLAMSPQEMPADHSKGEPWIVIADGPCPSCGWTIGFGRFKTRALAEAFKAPCEKAA